MTWSPLAHLDVAIDSEIGDDALERIVQDHALYVIAGGEPIPHAEWMRFPALVKQALAHIAGSVRCV